MAAVRIVVPPLVCRYPFWLPPTRRFSGCARQGQAAAASAASATTTNTIDRHAITPTRLYEHRVERGILRNDSHQRSIVRVLQDMWDQLATYDPPAVPHDAPTPPSLWSRLTSSLSSSAGAHEASIPPIPPSVPKGLYLYGSVGTGKSMLMDLFYDSLLDRPQLTHQRVHFHQFMIDVHKRNHQLAQEHGPRADVIVPIAREIATHSRVLCFDEFQVTDIVDAMILKRLLEAMMAYGVVCVLTSNRHPDELYKNGIQRSSFLPCIDLIKARFRVQDLNSGTDYRKLPRALSRVYYDPINTTTTREMDKLFNALTEDEPVHEGRVVEVWGRQLRVPQSTHHVAKFSFEELCGRNLSAADYLELTRTFGTIFIVNVPKLDFSQRDRARRFILFIDAAYESKTKLFTLSEVPITEIFSDRPDQTNAAASTVWSPDMRAAMDDLGLDAASMSASSIFSGEEELFAWARAVSRLHEMGTVGWAQTHAHSHIHLRIREEAAKQRTAGQDEDEGEGDGRSSSRHEVAELAQTIM